METHFKLTEPTLSADEIISLDKATGNRKNIGWIYVCQVLHQIGKDEFQTFSADYHNFSINPKLALAGLTMYIVATLDGQFDQKRAEFDISSPESFWQNIQQIQIQNTNISAKPFTLGQLIEYVEKAYMDSPIYSEEEKNFLEGRFKRLYEQVAPTMIKIESLELSSFKGTDGVRLRIETNWAAAGAYFDIIFPEYFLMDKASFTKAKERFLYFTTALQWCDDIKDVVTDIEDGNKSALIGLANDNLTESGATELEAIRTILNELREYMKIENSTERTNLISRRISEVAPKSFAELKRLAEEHKEKANLAACELNYRAIFLNPFNS